MLFGIHWAFLLTGLLGLAFIANGVTNAAGVGGVKEGFEKWGFPDWWHLVNGAVCLVIGSTLFIEELRPLGFMIGVAECVAIFTTLIVNREPGHLPPSVILLGLILTAYWGLYGFSLPGLL